MMLPLFSKRLTCQQVKVDQKRPGGTLHPLPTLECKWGYIKMDFILGLSRTKSRCNAIWTTLDRLTKFFHFLEIKMTNCLDKLSQPYLWEIVCLHDVRLSIVSGGILASYLDSGIVYTMLWIQIWISISPFTTIR